VTTFTSDDREEAYKKILEEAPAHIGYEDAVDPVACGVTIEVEPIPFAGMVTIRESKYTKEDADEAFFNLGKLMARLPLDEAKRLEMMVRIICNYVGQLEEKR
jgi:hypothetical protein